MTARRDTFRCEISDPDCMGVEWCTCVNPGLECGADDCPNCGGDGEVWGCFEDCCSCADDDGLGCDPQPCEYCGG